MSKVLTNRLQANFNAGVSYVPDTQGADLDDYSLGASADRRADSRLRPDARVARRHPISRWTTGQSDRDFVSRISPGARYALNVAGGQLVLGLAAPIGTTPDSPDWGAFLYVSFERRFWH